MVWHVSDCIDPAWRENQDVNGLSSPDFFEGKRMYLLIIMGISCAMIMLNLVYLLFSICFCKIQAARESVARENLKKAGIKKNINDFNRADDYKIGADLHV